MKLHLGLFSMVFLCALVAGCGDDDDATDGGPDGGGGESLSFVVMGWSVDEDTWVPLEGATVAFDAPGGERTEAVSGADGTVTFDGIDWSLGTAAATAHAEGYVLQSVVDVEPSVVGQLFSVDGAVALLLGNETPPLDTVAVSGTATGLLDETHQLVVNVASMTNAVQGESDWQGLGNGTFSVDVPSGEPFILQAVEVEASQTLSSGQGYDMPIHQWMQKGFDPVTDDLSDVSLDFGTDAMEMHTAGVSAEVPSREDSLVRAGYGVCLVCATNAFYCQGWSTYLDISEDGDRFEASLVWVEPEYAQDKTVALCRVHEQGTWRFLSQSNSFGYPEDGDEVPPLLDEVELTTPASAGTPHPLHDAFEWVLYDEDLPDVALNLVRGTDWIWQVKAPPGATTLTVPEPPSSVDTAELYGEGYLGATVYAGFFNVDDGWWERVALSVTAHADPQ